MLLRNVDWFLTGCMALELRLRYSSHSTISEPEIPGKVKLSLWGIKLCHGSL
jgi:hypothetical protein